MKSLTVLKIGGNVIDCQHVLEGVLRDFATWQGAKILVHGGGKVANKLMTQLGIEPKMVDGRRITDRETLDIVTMVYGGLINKNIVATLQSNSCNAIGLTGADANVIPATKRQVKNVDYGYVGDLKQDCISSDTIAGFLETGLVPVIAPITHDSAGTLLNTNADTIASSVAVAMSKTFKVFLVYCFEKKGVLRNPADDNSVIDFLDEILYNQYKNEGIITAGMIPKLDNAFEALHSGVYEVIKCCPGGFKEGTRIVVSE